MLEVPEADESFVTHEPSVDGADEARRTVLPDASCHNPGCDG